MCPVVSVCRLKKMRLRHVHFSISIAAKDFKILLLCGNTVIVFSRSSQSNVIIIIVKQTNNFFLVSCRDRCLSG